MEALIQTSSSNMAVQKGLTSLPRAQFYQITKIQVLTAAFINRTDNTKLSIRVLNFGANAIFARKKGRSMKV